MYQSCDIAPQSYKNADFMVVPTLEIFSRAIKEAEQECIHDKLLKYKMILIIILKNA